MARVAVPQANQSEEHEVSGVINVLNILSESRDRLAARIAKLEAKLEECEFQAATKSDKDRIAELVDELATVNALLDMKRERAQHWEDEAWRYKDMNEQLRAERNAT